MYSVEAFRETRIDVLHAQIEAHPLATLVTSTSDGLEANHIPLLLHADPSPLGTLRGHIARANPLWRTFKHGTEALAIFHGPQGYVTPSWYPSKAQHGKVVPTWNYAVVHAYGTLTFIDDAAWLRSFVTQLTASRESSLEKPWKVTDAPADYIDAMLKAIVGIEIPVTRLLGKWKLSQNRLPQDRAGVAAGLAARDSEADRSILDAMRK